MKTKGILALVVAVVASAPFGLTTATAADAPSTASVLGGGVILDGFGTFSVSAQSGPQGVFGRINATYRPPGEASQSFDIDVKCLSVVGATAFATGVIVKASPGSIPGIGDFAGFLMKDGGNASEAPVDGFTSTFGLADENPVTACHSIDGPYFSFTNVTAGNITISSS